MNVSVAFAPNVLEAMFSDRENDKGDMLSFGIFCLWFALVLRTIWA